MEGNRNRRAMECVLDPPVALDPARAHYVGMTDAPPGSARPSPAPHLTRARAVARILDDLVRIPGTSWRVGIDPLLGLIPGAGDWVAWTAGLHLIWAAWRTGAGPRLLLRMSGNLLLDAVVGAVPLAGDLFDAAWKANNRNLALLEAHARDPERTARASGWVLGGILGGTLALLGAGAWAAYVLLSAIWGLLA